MKQERLKVLALLEEGKITADEATKLLETLQSGDDQSFFSEETGEQVEEKLQRFAKNMDTWARDFGQKVEQCYRDVEPKLKKASQTVLEKTAAIVDDVSKSLHESIENAKNRAEEAEKRCEEDCKPKDDDNKPRPN